MEEINILDSTESNKKVESLPAARPPRTAIEYDRQREHARYLFSRWSHTSTSYMTLDPSYHLFFDDSNQAYLAYRCRLGVAFTVGDPIGAPEAVAKCIPQFIRFCTRNGWLPAFFAVENHHQLFRRYKFSGMQVAEDVYLNLNKMEFKGKTWQDVRTAISRSKRENIGFYRYDPATTPDEVSRQFRQISREWLKTKKLPELRFMLGDTGTIHDPAIRTYYALENTGKVHGFVSLLPRNGANGWTLDLMRRRADAMPGIMEFLIASAALLLREEGYACLALGASPLAPIQRKRSLSLAEKFLRKAKGFMEDYYAFDSLYAFKSKFQPEWRPLFMFYPGSYALTRISLALPLLYMTQPKHGGKHLSMPDTRVNQPRGILPDPA